MKKLLAFLFFLLIAPYFLSVSPFLKEKYSSSRTLYDQNDNLLRMTLSDDDKYRQWTSLDKIPKNIKEVFLLKEDQYFNWHIGANPVSLVNAFFDTYIAKKIKRGGSTITMQVARLHWGLHTRSVSGKLKQVALAYFLELTHSKDQILEAYLNITPYGKNIEGVKAASEIYFKKDLKDLILPEVLTLASLPQRPRVLNQHKSFASAPAILEKSKKQLFEQWLVKFPQDKFNRDAVELPSWLYGIKDIPFIAPHFSEYILKRYGNKDTLKTSLNLTIQNNVNKILKSYIQENKARGLENAVTMVVDAKSMNVVTLVGSADYFNKSISGQVNGALAPRSPGSTLKPLAYALALEQGIVHGKSILYDAPLDFRTPENFDSKFKGPITVEEALVTSRNVPAVYLSSKIKNPNLYSLIKNSGIKNLKPWAHYGNGLVLGVLDMSMAELVYLYGTFRNEGIAKSLKWLKDQKSEEIKLLDSESVAMTMELMAKNPRPNFVTGQSFVKKQDPVYWKTGTSIGFRDAWSIGIFRNFIVATWIGNFSGKSHPLLVGGKAAAPLFFKIVDSLKEYSHQSDNYYPMLLGNLEEIEVCSVSGHLPNKLCPHKTKTLFRPGISPASTCKLHRNIPIHVQSKKRACDGLKGEVENRVFEIWPSHVLELFNKIGLSRVRPPKYHPHCQISNKSQLGDQPKILSPKKGLSYTVRLSDQRRTIKFQSRTDSDVKEVFWYVNDSFVGRSGPEKSFLWQAEPGKHVVKLVDDRGRNTFRNLNVVLVQ